MTSFSAMLTEQTISATAARNNIGRLWASTARGPIMVISAGRPVAVVLSPADYDSLKRDAGHGGRPVPTLGFARHLLPDLDPDELMGVDISADLAGYV